CAFKRYAAAKRVANEMRAGFAVRRQEGQSETSKIGNRVAVLLRLVGQAMAEHVEGVDTVPRGQRHDIAPPFQNRAADSGEENDSRAGPSRLPETGAECTDIRVPVLKRVGGGFARFDDDRKHGLSLFQ